MLAKNYDLNFVTILFIKDYLRFLCDLLCIVRWWMVDIAFEE
jgi:hypothetical protein